MTNFDNKESRDNTQNEAKADDTRRNSDNENTRRNSFNEHTRRNSDHESDSQKGEKPKNRGVSPDMFSHLTEDELKAKVKDLTDKIEQEKSSNRSWRNFYKEAKNKGVKFPGMSKFWSRSPSLSPTRGATSRNVSPNYQQGPSRRFWKDEKHPNESSSYDKSYTSQDSGNPQFSYRNSKSYQENTRNNDRYSRKEYEGKPPRYTEHSPPRYNRSEPEGNPRRHSRKDSHYHQSSEPEGNPRRHSRKDSHYNQSSSGRHNQYHFRGRSNSGSNSESDYGGNPYNYKKYPAKDLNKSDIDLSKINNDPPRPKCNVDNDKRKIYYNSIKDLFTKGATQEYIDRFIDQGSNPRIHR